MMSQAIWSLRQPSLLMAPQATFLDGVVLEKRKNVGVLHQIETDLNHATQFPREDSSHELPELCFL